MVGPIHNTNGINSAVQSVELISRGDIGISGTQQSTELGSTSVAGVDQKIALPNDIPPQMISYAEKIKKIKSEYKDIELATLRAKELESIREKLLLGKQKAQSGTFNSTDLNNYINFANENLAKNATNSNITKKTNHENIQNSTSNKNSNVSITAIPQKDPNQVGLDVQQVVIGRIDDVLNTLNTVLAKINSDTSKSSDYILALSSTVAGLNTAKTTIDNSKLSVDVASNSVDLIINNIKTAISSHSNLSTELVRLALA